MPKGPKRSSRQQEPPKASHVEIRDFLEVVHGSSKGQVVISTFGRGGTTQFFPISDLDEAVAEAALKARHADVYVSCCTRNKALAAGKRGGAEDALTMPGVWADLDGDWGEHRSRDPLPNREQILSLLAEFGVPPTLLLESGGGFQAWWLFKEPILLDDGNRSAAADLARLAVSTLQALGERHGWGGVDSVGELGRVLRLPGTLNHKTTPPRPVRVVEWHPDRRYTPDEIRQQCLSIEPSKPITLRQPTEVTNGETSSVYDVFSTVVSWDELLRPLGFEPEGQTTDERETWRHPAQSTSRPTPAATTGRQVLVVWSDSSAEAMGLPSGKNQKLTKYRVWGHANYRDRPNSARRAFDDFANGRRQDLPGLSPETLANLRAAIEAAEIESWDDPIPLPHRTPLPPFPVGVFGPQGRYLLAVAAMGGTAPDIAAATMLAAVSTVVGGTLRAGIWEVPTNLYLVVIAASGEGKSPVFKQVIAPLVKIDRARQEEAVPRIRELKQEKKMAEGRAKHSEAVAMKASDEGEAHQRAVRLGIEADEIIVPAYPRLYTTEATPEALLKLLGDQNGSGALLTDEGVDFFDMTSRYSGNGKANWGILKAGFDGERYISDRASRDPIDIERVTLTVLAMAQPIVLLNLATDAQAQGQGVLARFMWLLPSSKVGLCPTRRPPVPEDLAEGWERLLVQLAEAVQKREGQPQAGDDEDSAPTGPIVLSLSPEATDLFDSWHARHEPRRHPETGDLAVCVEWASKLPGNVQRFAAILHVISTGRLTGVISKETMTDALSLGDYFAAHARRVWGHLGADPATEDAARLLRWLLAWSEPEVTTRDVYRSKDWQADRVRSAFRFLEDSHYVRRTPARKGAGRPSEAWTINPRIDLTEPDETTKESYGKRVLSGSVRHLGGSGERDEGTA